MEAEPPANTIPAAQSGSYLRRLSVSCLLKNQREVWKIPQWTSVEGEGWQSWLSRQCRISVYDKLSYSIAVSIDTKQGFLQPASHLKRMTLEYFNDGQEMDGGELAHFGSLCFNVVLPDLAPHITTTDKRKPKPRHLVGFINDSELHQGSGDFFRQIVLSCVVWVTRSPVSTAG
ncbi:hypothetical protein ARMGADRAFT_1082883 [Armillaria gallica]|uniref:Uncharacterized protein n=1 Tax=Armillaria gallica TaxID=47427 RepID=A0A2H3D3X2_ARMGA|nr:hypothetical protein ARMGADRAFT_1082883 [Armillaria gallica]